jgi:ABC-2 type transport system permease protein
MNGPGGVEVATGAGWLAGYGTLLDRENRKWWRSRRWLGQLVLWAAVLNGMVAFVLLAMPRMMAAAGEAMPDDAVVVAMTLFFALGTVGVAIGAIILTHSRVVDEKRHGTAAWVLSKPVSRAAFVLSRITADAIAMLAVMVLAPALIAYGLVLAVGGGAAVTPAAFAAAVAILALHLAFYLALTYLAGVFAETTATVLGICLGILLLGMLLRGVAGPVALVTPWMLGDLAAALALEDPIPRALWLAPASSAFLTAGFLAGAVAGFNRQEL